MVAPTPYIATYTYFQTTFYTPHNNTGNNWSQA